MFPRISNVIYHKKKKIGKMVEDFFHDRFAVIINLIPIFRWLKTNDIPSDNLHYAVVRDILRMYVWRKVKQLLFIQIF